MQFGCGDTASGDGDDHRLAGPARSVRPNVAVENSGDALSFACRLAVAVFPGVRWAGVVVASAGAPFAAAASDQRAITLQQTQYELDDGPSYLRAVRHERSVSLQIDDIAIRRPGLARTARSSGIGSTFAAPPSRAGKDRVTVSMTKRPTR